MNEFGNQIQQRNVEKSILPLRQVDPKTTDTLKEAIAENITAIVGLKEALLWSEKRLRHVWSVCLCVGIFMTFWFVYKAAEEYASNPTAAKVQLQTNTSYEFPILFVCPDSWLDAETAFAMGLSKEALIYSLGYLSEGFGNYTRPSNVLQAKKEFLKFYNDQKFNSLEEYFKSIAQNFTLVSSTDDAIADPEATVQCEECTEGENPLEKLIFDERVCYQIRKKPVQNQRMMTYQYSAFMFAMPDRTRGLRSAKRTWPLHVSHRRRFGLKTDPVTPLYLALYAWNFIRITEIRVEHLRMAGSKCAIRDPGTSFSAQICYVSCMSQATSDALGCVSFILTPSQLTYNYPPDGYCNLYDNSSRNWHALYGDGGNNFSYHGTECSKTCPQYCDDTVYDIATRSQIDMAYSPTLERLFEAKSSSHNQSYYGLALHMEHAAMVHGGIWNIIEVNTLSFTSLVSNVGGALGLFVGGTMMSFVQIVMFLAKYCIEKGRKQ